MCSGIEAYNGSITYKRMMNVLLDIMRVHQDRQIFIYYQIHK